MLIQNIKSYEDFQNYITKYKFVIVNISAIWCKPCMAIKPNLEKFISVISDLDIIYLKIDHSVYEEDSDFSTYFNLNKIPYFAFIKEKNIVDSFVSGDFKFVSKRLFDNIKSLTLSSYEFKKDDDF